MKKPNPYMIDEENPEWTEADFKRAVPTRLIHPDLAEWSKRRKQGQRGPQKAPIKQAISIRVDKDVLDHFRARPRYQTRINTILRMVMEEEKSGHR